MAAYPTQGAWFRLRWGLGKNAQWLVDAALLQFHEGAFLGADLSLIWHISPPGCSSFKETGRDCGTEDTDWMKLIQHSTHSAFFVRRHSACLADCWFSSLCSLPLAKMSNSYLVGTIALWLWPVPGIMSALVWSRPDLLKNPLQIHSRTLVWQPENVLTVHLKGYE